jgi:hypothetical protein
MSCLDHFFVVADAVGAPHVDHAVCVAGIVLGDARHQLGVHVLEIGELRFVERQVDARLDLPLEVRGRGHDHVETARAGEQLGLEGFVGVEIGDVDLDARLFLEVRQRVRREVIGPDVEVQNLAGICAPVGRLDRPIRRSPRRFPGLGALRMPSIKREKPSASIAAARLDTAALLINRIPYEFVARR